MGKFLNVMLGKKFFSMIPVGVFCLFVSCTTFTYPNMKTHDYKHAYLYEMGNLSGNTLIIGIEGSGWRSTLGRNWNGIWFATSASSYYLNLLMQEHTVIIPEKWRRDPRTPSGINSGVYYEDLQLRLLYTIEGLIENYAESINLYLSSNPYESIFLIGFSEGAIILPLLYDRIYEKEKIKGMIVYAGGGLSGYDVYTILNTAKITPKRYREMYAYIIENHDKGIEAWSNSIGVDKYGTVLLWITSILEFRPFEYYEKINIPVLFLHGTRDYNVAVESTRYIQENLPEKPFEYIYYGMEHGPNPWLPNYYFLLSRIRNDIINWINKIQIME